VLHLFSQSTDMDPEVVSDVKDSVATVVDKCIPTQNWEVCGQLHYFWLATVTTNSKRSGGE